VAAGGGNGWPAKSLKTNRFLIIFVKDDVPSQGTALIPFHSCVSLSYLGEDVNGCPVAADCPVTAHRSRDNPKETI